MKDNVERGFLWLCMGLLFWILSILGVIVFIVLNVFFAQRYTDWVFGSAYSNFIAIIIASILFNLFDLIVRLNKGKLPKEKKDIVHIKKFFNIGKIVILFTVPIFLIWQAFMTISQGQKYAFHEGIAVNIASLAIFVSLDALVSKIVKCKDNGRL